jgi:hypothetical protein
MFSSLVRPLGLSWFLICDTFPIVFDVSSFILYSCFAQCSLVWLVLLAFVTIASLALTLFECLFLFMLLFLNLAFACPRLCI